MECRLVLPSGYLLSMSPLPRVWALPVTLLAHQLSTQKLELFRLIFCHHACHRLHIAALPRYGQPCFLRMLHPSKHILQWGVGFSPLLLRYLCWEPRIKILLLCTIVRQLGNCSYIRSSHQPPHSYVRSKKRGPLERLQQYVKVVVVIREQARVTSKSW
eukprot:3828549-Amphidinium_carterae.1